MISLIIGSFFYLSVRLIIKEIIETLEKGHDELKLEEKKEKLKGRSMYVSNDQNLKIIVNCAEDHLKIVFN
jgi:hypothetical protein